jgi:hypothetical protein
MVSDRDDLLKTLNASIRELQESVDTHYSLIINLLQGESNGRFSQASLRQCPKRSREHRLEQAMRETIEVLEETRKSFKSKQLAELRKKLTNILMEND